ncbi:MAG: trigger factor [Treponema sp.]|nr:trigger factor [Treponema sp.]
MTISKEITRLEHSRIKLVVSIGKDDVALEYDAILNDFSKDIQIPGFRKGKVPKNVIERKFGSALVSDITGHIVERAIETVFQDESFPKEDMPLSYSPPVLEGEPSNITLGEDYTFTATYDVFPKVTMGRYEGLEIETPDVRITDGDINRELEAVRERNAVVLDKDDAAPAAKGDVATVNYCELTAEGAVEKGSEREDFVFAIGSGRNLFKFDDDLIGLKKGESKDIEKTYAEDFEDKDLAGKTKKIRVTLTNLKEKKLPDLDDDLAQDVDEKFKTLDDLKNSVRERLERNLEHRLKNITINALLEKIMENTPVDIPEAMIRVQLDAQWRNFARQLNMPADTVKENIAKSGKGLDEFEALWRPEAAKALHSRLVIETLMKDLNVEATEEDIEKELEHQAAQSGRSGRSLDEIKKIYEQENMKSHLEDDIKENKLFDLLLAKNTVKSGGAKDYLTIMEEKGQ